MGGKRSSRGSKIKSLNQWIHFVRVRKKIKNQVKRITCKWINQNLTFGWRAWILFITKYKENVLLVTQQSNNKKRHEIPAIKITEKPALIAEWLGMSVLA